MDNIKTNQARTEPLFLGSSKRRRTDLGPCRVSMRRCCSWQRGDGWYTTDGYWGFLKWWYPTTMGPTNNDHPTCSIVERWC